MSEADQARPEMTELLEQLRNATLDWADPRIPSLLSWLRAGQRRSELQGLVRDTASRIHTLSPAHARQLLVLLSELELVELAYPLSALPHLAADPEVAAQRARLAMRVRDYAAAIAASELAITALLQPGLSFEEFLRLCVAGAPAEGMLRFDRRVLADHTHLSERLALRWEALHRAGMTRDASLMQLMCQRYFPERASVWATAGNHALDADDLSAAQKYFERCLQLDASWTAALAGLAIVHERRKDWGAALPYRRRVLELEHALARDDAASLHRRIRYAAALARVGRWRDAEPLLRSAARSAELVRLPAERLMLLRVFSQELYAPALVSALSGTADATDPAALPEASSAADQALREARQEPAHEAALSRTADATDPAALPEASSAADQALREARQEPALALARQEAALSRTADATDPAALRAANADLAQREARQEPALALARHEAALLARLRARLMAAELDASARRWALALCCYLSGELEQAFEQLDQVELEKPDDLAVHFLLWRCSSALGHEQTASIRAFAEQAARTLWATRQRAELSGAQLDYAVAILPELGPEVRAAGYALHADALEELAAVAGAPLAQLERLTAFRATHRSPLAAAAAAASTHVLAALATSA